MNKVKVLFTYDTGYAGVAETKETVVLELTDEELERKDEVIEEEFVEWVWNQIYNAQWEEIEE